MMYTIIATIKTEHLNNIRRGRKTIELRKSVPQRGFPFRVLLCESGSGGKIKAEFVCESCLVVGNPNDDLSTKTCLHPMRIRGYIGNGCGYGWQITNMIDYCSTPGYRVRNISEYGLKRSPQSWQYVKEDD